mgnify:CR=1 FL=1
MNSKLFSYYLFGGIDVKYLLLAFSISLPFHSYLTIQSSFLKSFKKAEIAPLYEIGLMVLLTAFFTLLYSFLVDEVEAYEGALFFLISCLLVFFAGNYRINKELSLQDGYKKNQYEKYDNFYSTLWNYGFSNVFSYFLKFSPILILGFYHSSLEVSYYSIANNTAYLINFVLWIVSSVYAPYFANLFKENKLDELNRHLTRSTIYMLIVAIPIFLVIVAFPQFFLTIFDPNYSGSTASLNILAFAQLINVATALSSS